MFAWNIQVFDFKQEEVYKFKVSCGRSISANHSQLTLPGSQRVNRVHLENPKYWNWAIYAEVLRLPHCTKNDVLH